MVEGSCACLGSRRGKQLHEGLGASKPSVGMRTDYSELL